MTKRTNERRKLWIDSTGEPVVTTTLNGEKNAAFWGWTEARAVPADSSIDDDAPLTDLPDPRRVAEFRHRGGGFRNRGGGFPSERWVHSVTVGRSGEVWINGAQVPWFIHKDGVRVEWGEPFGGDEVRIGRLVLELMVSDDDTIITDLRPARIEAEIVPDGT
jgi:hypothetical protein